MNKLDKFLAEAESIRSAVEAAPLLSKVYVAQPGEMVINDPKAAWKYCSSQNLPDDYEYWTGLRERNYAEKLDSLQKLLGNERLKDEYFNAADEVDGEMLKLIKKQTSKLGLEKGVAGAISEDFTKILEKRAFRSKPHEWAERMFRIYMSGGWPCGWHGKYPAGQLIVYSVKS